MKLVARFIVLELARSLNALNRNEKNLSENRIGLLPKILIVDSKLNNGRIVFQGGGPRSTVKR